MLPTIESLKSQYPDIMSAHKNQTLKENWENNEREYDEPYPHCNYCIGGAIQMAFGEIKPLDDDALDGIFPSITALAETLHWFLDIPYALGQEGYCTFPRHKHRSCVTQEYMQKTAYVLAREIIRANDTEQLDLAWSLTEQALRGG